MDRRSLMQGDYMALNYSLENVVLMQYRVRNGSLKFANNAFFFHEGHSPLYQTARFGDFHVDSKGELLLTAMYDKKPNKLGPKQKIKSP